MTKPTLVDGLTVIVKRECETCRMVVPAIEQLRASGANISLYVQDDPRFPEGLGAIHDADLAVSWHHDVETVPTVIKVVDGREVDRTVGWSRDDWERVTGAHGLAPSLPAFRPGCGSMSVDPDLVDTLRVRFGATTLTARRNFAAGFPLTLESETMIISPTMHLGELAERMGQITTEAEARAMRDILVDLRDGEDTADIEEHDWICMLEMVTR